MAEPTDANRVPEARPKPAGALAPLASHTLSEPKDLADLEASRLKELYALNILDRDKEASFDRYTALVADLFNMPIVLLRLVDKNRQWLKSCTGLAIEGTDHSVAFCACAVAEQEILIIPDTLKDPQFSENPWVINEPKIRFYAGAVLRGPTGQTLGTLCMMDKQPRTLNEKQGKQLIQFARLVEHELNFGYHLDAMRTKVENALYHDVRTGLPNRRLLQERLEHAITTLQPGQQIAVIALNIDRLSELENAVGSEATALILNESNQRLTQVLGKVSVVAQWENDCFIMFLGLDAATESLAMNIENIIKAFEAPFIFNEERYVFSCHLGVSLCPLDGKLADQLVMKSIYAMHAQSSDSNLLYHFYSNESTKRIAKQYMAERMLKKAIDSGALELVYQPKIDIASGSICGVEALCRWNDAAHGMISPMEFIPLAEQSDLIVQLGAWALKQACTQIQQWQSQGSKKFPVSVNVSQKQLLKKDFHENVQKILADSKLEPQYLDLEVTESSLIQMDQSIENMNKICQLGVHFSLDDFGTGFSSLSYLQRLPLKTLKIDQSFIKNIASNSHDAALVSAIVAMSRALNLHCVAEGVETQEQLLFLRAYQCDQMQGYLFSPPLKADAFKALLDSNKGLGP